MLPEAADLALLEHPQELALQRRRHLRDLVEEEGSVVGELEAARARRGGAGERALLVAEELALEERLGDRRAVEGDETRGGARTQVVDRARDDLLAGAALAGDQDRGLRGGDLVDQAVKLEHPRGLADELLEPAAADHLAPQEQYLLAHRRPLQSLHDDRREAFGLDRLDEVVVDAAPRRLDRAVDRAVRGQDDEGRLDPVILEIGDQVETAAAGKLEVGDDQVGR